MAPNDDGDQSRTPAPEDSGVTSKPRGRVRGAPPRQRPARVRATRSRPAATSDGTGEERRPRAREAAVDPSQKRKIDQTSIYRVVVVRTRDEGSLGDKWKIRSLETLDRRTTVNGKQLPRARPSAATAGEKKATGP